MWKNRIKYILLILLIFNNCIHREKPINKTRIRQLFQLMINDIEINKTDDFFNDFDMIFKEYCKKYNELNNIGYFYNEIMVNSAKFESYKIYDLKNRFRVYDNYKKMAGKVFYNYFEICY